MVERNEREEFALYQYKSNFLSSPVCIFYFRTLDNNTAERVLEKRTAKSNLYIKLPH